MSWIIIAMLNAAYVDPPVRPTVSPAVCAPAPCASAPNRKITVPCEPHEGCEEKWLFVDKVDKEVPIS